MSSCAAALSGFAIGGLFLTANTIVTSDATRTATNARQRTIFLVREGGASSAGCPRCSEWLTARSGLGSGALDAAGSDDLGAVPGGPSGGRRGGVSTAGVSTLAAGGFVGHWAFSPGTKTWRQLVQRSKVLGPLRAACLGAIRPEDAVPMAKAMAGAQYQGRVYACAKILLGMKELPPEIAGDLVTALGRGDIASSPSIHRQEHLIQAIARVGSPVGLVRSRKGA